MRRTYWGVAALAVAMVLAAGPAAWAVQYPNLAAGYTQEIYTGPLRGGPGMAWTSSNHLLTRDGTDILEYSPTQNTTHQGTALHGVIATHTIAGLSASGYGMTNGLDGYIYTVTGLGLERFNPSNWAAPAQFMTGSVGGQGYGVTTLSDGRIAYADGFGNSNVYVYDPVAMTNTLIYSANFLIDGMVGGPGGYLAVTGQSNSTMTILTSSGAVVQTFATAHYPDGLAFGASLSSWTLYSNNNDGTITRYAFGPGFAGTPVATDIAYLSGAYGDLAAVGPDCAFYVSQFDNSGYHGSIPGVGTHWDNGTTNSEPSIIRVGSADGECLFYTPLEAPPAAPEPVTGTAAMLGIGGLGLYMGRRRERKGC